ncbi:uncharacterized protein LOC134343574 isoform X2 [Mobula hypostoma]|uniref:uncharacterized protein LOC134343574 isoform X2 n=1 Tax=Mobula hypostoma TaxID=723540 RepID=UPI002FC3C072
MTYISNGPCDNIRHPPDGRDELNLFYARFDVASIESLRAVDTTCSLVISEAEVCWRFQRVDSHKAARPDGIPGRVLQCVHGTTGSVSRVEVEMLPLQFCGLRGSGCQATVSIARILKTPATINYLSSASATSMQSTTPLAFIFSPLLANTMRMPIFGFSLAHPIVIRIFAPPTINKYCKHNLISKIFINDILELCPSKLLERCEPRLEHCTSKGHCLVSLFSINT